MSSTTKALREAVLSLPPDERAELADDIWASLDDAHRADVEAVWNEEIERRAQELDKGRLTPIPMNEALRRLRERNSQ